MLVMLMLKLSRGLILICLTMLVMLMLKLSRDLILICPKSR